MPISETTSELESDASSSAGFLTEKSSDLLRFSTAGSVDDGKSTLIGRLLYDTQSVYEDQVRSIEGKGTTGAGVLDLALLTDGLRAEREQGITIDVAYRYFSTSTRKFIIADTPGHEQYTRNMATGASTASLAIVLVDARKGVLIQSRRHACITALLGVRHIVVAVNKMDLVNYGEQVFNSIRKDFTAFFELLGDLRPPYLYFIPVSALEGDNVVHRTSAMPWYAGPSLLELLESVPAAEAGESDPFRFVVQRVLRPNQNFRGFAGQIAAGTIRPGDSVMVLPSRRTSHIRKIVTFDGDLQEAFAPQSVTLTLTDELDIGRGDLIVTPESPAVTTKRFTASLVWMDEQPLDLGRRYLLKHTSRTVQAQVVAIQHRLDVTTLERQPATTLTINGIGLVEIGSVQPLTVDSYASNRTTGSFVLIDPISNATVAAGMIREATAKAPIGLTEPVSGAERTARWHHSGALIHISGPKSFAYAVERALFLRGAFIVRFTSVSPDTFKALTSAGVLVMTHIQSDEQTVTLNHQEVFVTANVDELLRTLEDYKILQGETRR
jgi:sulfate adenylyltransferase large subunit